MRACCDWRTDPADEGEDTHIFYRAHVSGELNGHRNLEWYDAFKGNSASCRDTANIAGHADADDMDTRKRMQSAHVGGQPASGTAAKAFLSINDKGSAVVYLICSIAKLELTSFSGMRAISFLYSRS